MEIHIGPVPGGSVTIWVAYARTVLAQAMTNTSGFPPVDLQIVEEFEAYLDAWEAAADPAEPFVWSAQADPERLSYIAHTFLQLVQNLAEQAETRGFPIAPTDGEAFYQALVSALIDALDTEGRTLADYAEQLRDRWPGFKEP